MLYTKFLGPVADIKGEGGRGEGCSLFNSSLLLGKEKWSKKKTEKKTRRKIEQRRTPRNWGPSVLLYESCCRKNSD